MRDIFIKIYYMLVGWLIDLTVNYYNNLVVKIHFD